MVMTKAVDIIWEWLGLLGVLLLDDATFLPLKLNSGRIVVPTAIAQVKVLKNTAVNAFMTMTLLHGHMIQTMLMSSIGTCPGGMWAAMTISSRRKT